MSNEKSTVMCCVSGIVLPSNIGIIVSHYKDPIKQQYHGKQVGGFKYFSYFLFSPRKLVK